MSLLLHRILPALPLMSAVLFLNACGVTLQKSTLYDGVFVANSREIKNGAKVGEADVVDERHILKFGDLTGEPQDRFLGRLTSRGGIFWNKEKVRSRRIETLSKEAFHADSEKKRRLAEEGKLNPDILTFREAVGDSQSVMIYVHGFNNDARDAAQQTLEVHKELQAIGHDTTILFYTWPTSKSYLGVVVGGVVRRVTFGALDALLNDYYLGDRKNVDLASHALYALYEELSSEYPDLNIDILAHSMGSEVTLKSFLLWHYQKLAQGKTSPEEVAVVRRVVLVGADIGIDTFKILAQPTSYAAESILVYVNPRDEVLKESAVLNQQSRLGTATIDEALTGVSEEFTFVEIRDALVPRGVNLPRLLLVNHNAIRDDRIRRHAAGFIMDGRVERDDVDGIALYPVGGEEESDGEAARYRLALQPDVFKDTATTVNALASPLLILPNIMGDAADALQSTAEEE